MCNINLVYYRKRENNPFIPTLMNTLSTYSWIGNHDGEGYLEIGNEGKRTQLVSFRTTKKIVYSRPCWFLSTHQRLATSGLVNDSNTHPHSTKDLRLQHNGIFYSMGNREKSDTKEYIERLQDTYTKTDGNLLRALTKVHSSINGSYSIVLHERPKNRILYYKNNSTTINCFVSHDWVVLSTSRDNAIYATLVLGQNFKERKIEEHIVYNILEGMQPIGKFIHKNQWNERKEKQTKYFDYGFSNDGFSSIGASEADKCFLHNIKDCATCAAMNGGGN